MNVVYSYEGGLGLVMLFNSLYWDPSCETCCWFLGALFFMGGIKHHPKDQHFDKCRRGVSINACRGVEFEGPASCWQRRI
ncbi:hypothetical protein Dimus_010820 [Dionaea muscipula]